MLKKIETTSRKIKYVKIEGVAKIEAKKMVVRLLECFLNRSFK